MRHQSQTPAGMLLHLSTRSQWRRNENRSRISYNGLVRGSSRYNGNRAMRRLVWLLLAISAIAANAAEEARTWTNKDGRTMQAEFLREVDGDVTFLMKGGKLFTLPLDQLSDEDQKFIRNAEANKKVEEKAPPAHVEHEPMSRDIGFPERVTLQQTGEAIAAAERKAHAAVTAEILKRRYGGE